MIDSTQYYEVYNQTGEILQNVPPIVTTSDAMFFSVFVFIFFLYKKLSKNTGPNYIY